MKYIDGDEAQLVERRSSNLEGSAPGGYKTILSKTRRSKLSMAPTRAEIIEVINIC